MQHTATGRLRPTEPETASTERSVSLGARPEIDVTIPRTQITARMRLIGRSDSTAITAETRRLFKAAGLLDDQGRLVGVAADDWNAEIAIRCLAIAIRDPADTTKPLAPLEEWRQCDDDQIEALWSTYKDIREQFDPLADENVNLSAADIAQIESAVKKKESSVLMSFGLRKLSSYMLTLADRPAT